MTKILEVTESTSTVSTLLKLDMREIKKRLMTIDQDIKNLVGSYYDLQGLRISSGNKAFAAAANEKDQFIFKLIEDNFRECEKSITKIIKAYVEKDDVGKWLMSIVGIGPILAGGLLSYIDIGRCETAGSLWAYAGWEGEAKPRKRGEKCTYNPAFRKLCWLIGESFIKTPKGEYGQVYRKQLAFYNQKNEEGGFAARAAKQLATVNYSKTTEAFKAYSQGKLPKAHIMSMSRRYAVKMFLSHVFSAWYLYDRKKMPPVPFAIAHLEGHVHEVTPPNMHILFPNGYPCDCPWDMYTIDRTIFKEK